MLKKGINIRIIKKSKGEVITKKGKILKIYPSYILVKLDNWTECFNIADVVNPERNKLQIKKNGQWVAVTKDMLPSSMLKISDESIHYGYRENGSAYRRSR